jgi:hypothetical protein
MWNAREDGVAVINAGCNIDVYKYFNTLTLTEGGAQACDGKKALRDTLLVKETSFVTFTTAVSVLCFGRNPD